MFNIKYMSKNGKILYLIIEFEKDLREYLFNDVVSIFGEISTMGYLYSKAESRKNSKTESKHKDTFDLLSFGELGEFLSLNSNNLNPAIRHNVQELREAMAILVKNRNNFAHPHSVNEGFLDEGLSDHLRVYDAVELFQKTIEFEWKRTNAAFQFLSNPDFYINYEELITTLPLLIKDNLPEPQHNETKFIGRKDEIKKLNKYLESNRINLISICGPGGLGKTALALEVCSNLISEENDIFDRIVYFTFKNEDLLDAKNISKYEKKFSGFIQMVDEEFDYQCDDLTEVVEFLDEKKTLIILDNTEILSKNEILEFYYQFDNAKFILTSRVGLGEVETRINLKELKKEESLFLFRTLAEIEGVSDLINISQKKLEDLVISLDTPLGIKWSIFRISEGISVEEILSYKNELIKFCTEGIFENIEKETNKVLSLLYSDERPLTLGQISVFSELEIDIVQKSIIELDRRSLLLKKQEKSKFEESYLLVDQGREYINQNIEKFNEPISEINEIKKSFSLEALGDAKRDLNNQFNPRRIMLTSDSVGEIPKLLKLALSERAYNEKAKKYLENAIQLNPEFFEIYRVSAFIKASAGLNTLADSDFKKALKLATTDEEIAWIKFWYSGFLFRFTQSTKKDDYFYQLELAEEAFNFFDNIPTMINFAQIQTQLGLYEKTNDLLKYCIDEEKDSFLIRENRKVLNIYLENKRRQIFEHLLGQEGLSDVAITKSLEFITGFHEIIIGIKNDKFLFDNYSTYFKEFFRGIRYVSDDPNIREIEKHVDYFLEIPRPLITQDAEKRILSSIQTANENFMNRRYGNMDQLTEILMKASDYLNYKDTSEEKIIKFNGYLALVTNNSFQGFFRRYNNTRPRTLRGPSELIHRNNLKLSFGDKIQCDVIGDGRNLRILDVELIADYTKENINKRVLYLFHRKTLDDYPVIDMQTSFIFGALQKEAVVNQFGKELLNLGDYQYYLKGIVDSSKHRPVLNFDSIEPIYDSKYILQFSNLNALCFNYEEDTLIDKKIDSIQNEISQLVTGSKHEARIVNEELLHIGDITSKYERYEENYLHPRKRVIVEIVDVDTETLNVFSKIVSLVNR